MGMETPEINSTLNQKTNPLGVGDPTSPEAILPEESVDNLDPKLIKSISKQARKRQRAFEKKIKKIAKRKIKAAKKLLKEKSRSEKAEQKKISQITNQRLRDAKSKASKSTDPVLKEKLEKIVAQREAEHAQAIARSNELRKSQVNDLKKLNNTTNTLLNSVKFRSSSDNEELFSKISKASETEIASVIEEETSVEGSSSDNKNDALLNQSRREVARAKKLAEKEKERADKAEADRLAAEERAKEAEAKVEAKRLKDAERAAKILERRSRNAEAGFSGIIGRLRASRTPESREVRAQQRAELLKKREEARAQELILKREEKERQEQKREAQRQEKEANERRKKEEKAALLVEKRRRDDEQREAKRQEREKKNQERLVLRAEKAAKKEESKLAREKLKEDKQKKDKENYIKSTAIKDAELKSLSETEQLKALEEERLKNAKLEEKLLKAEARAAAKDARIRLRQERIRARAELRKTRAEARDSKSAEKESKPSRFSRLRALFTQPKETEASGSIKAIPAEPALSNEDSISKQAQDEGSSLSENKEEGLSVTNTSLEKETRLDTSNFTSLENESLKKINNSETEKSAEGEKTESKPEVKDPVKSLDEILEEAHKAHMVDDIANPIGIDGIEVLLKTLPEQTSDMLRLWLGSLSVEAQKRLTVDDIKKAIDLISKKQNASKELIEDLNKEIALLEAEVVVRPLTGELFTFTEVKKVEEAEPESEVSEEGTSEDQSEKAKKKRIKNEEKLRRRAEKRRLKEERKLKRAELKKIKAENKRAAKESLQKAKELRNQTKDANRRSKDASTRTPVSFNLFDNIKLKRIEREAGKNIKAEVSGSIKEIEENRDNAKSGFKLPAISVRKIKDEIRYEPKAEKEKDPQEEADVSEKERIKFAKQHTRDAEKENRKQRKIDDRAARKAARLLKDKEREEEKQRIIEEENLLEGSSKIIRQRRRELMKIEKLNKKEELKSIKERKKMEALDRKTEKRLEKQRRKDEKQLEFERKASEARRAIIEKETQRLGVNIADSESVDQVLLSPGRYNWSVEAGEILTHASSSEINHIDFDIPEPLPRKTTI